MQQMKESGWKAFVNEKKNRNPMKRWATGERGEKKNVFPTFCSISNQEFLVTKYQALLSNHRFLVTNKFLLSSSLFSSVNYTTHDGSIFWFPMDHLSSLALSGRVFGCAFGLFFGFRCKLLFLSFLDFNRIAIGPPCSSET